MDNPVQVREQKPSKALIERMVKSSPEQVIDRATKVADMLKRIIDQQKLFVEIQGKRYVIAEGWTTMGAMLGVLPFVEYVRRIQDETQIAYEARVVLRTNDGKQLAAAEGMCSDRELSPRGGKKWQDEYAVRSMAQTRATSKAFRLSFSWIMAIAGYQPTPAEEMTVIMTDQQTATVTPKRPLASGAQIALVTDLVVKLGYKNLTEFEEAWKRRVTVLNIDQVEVLIAKLLAKIKEKNKNETHV